ncbi:DEAH-box ATP-dependent RNA helicase prp22, partial [Coelomomyces lativittatus]
RIAAISNAKRVAKELNSDIGDTVGYSIRFENVTTSKTKLAYVTDGILLRELLDDPKLFRYDIVMIDEAHERTVGTDVLLGLLKKCIQERPALRLLIMSATLDVEKFSDFFQACPIFQIPGRPYPVEIMYSKNISFSTLKSSYVDRAIDTVFHIHGHSDQVGDILVFLTGSFEVERACQITRDLDKTFPHPSQMKGLHVYGIYSSLETVEQKAVFNATPKGYRKIVYATNIAQTSITIPGIVYVIDSGFVKQKMYDPNSHMDALLVMPISKASATQRAGRAGRTAPGKAYRLYSLETYQSEFPEETVPEIQRTSLLETILNLKALHIDDVLGFEFLDPPQPAQVLSALHQLYWLQALDDQGKITNLGQKLAHLPLSPFLGRALWAACTEFNCSYEMVIICAMLSVENVFLEFRDSNKFHRAQKKRSTLFHPLGDHLTLLQIYLAWKGDKYSTSFCKEYFLQFRALLRARNISKQLFAALTRLDKQIVSVRHPETHSIDFSPILQSFCTAFFCNLAKKHPSQPFFYQYSIANETNLADTTLLSFSTQSTCCLNQSIENGLVDWVFYHDVVYTTRAQMRHVTSILKLDWVEPYLDRMNRAKTLSLSGNTPSSCREKKTESVSTPPFFTEPTSQSHAVVLNDSNDDSEERKRKIEAAKKRALKRTKTK